MLFVEQYLSEAVTDVTPLRPDYPLGPHAMVALIAEGFGIRVDHAFAGWTMALPILNAWTALALVRRASWLKQAMTATVVGMPFLVAAYYGEGSFKEVLQAGLVLAVALLFSGYGPELGRGRWVPLALLVGGIVSVYSVTGLPWPVDDRRAVADRHRGDGGLRRRGTDGLKDAVLRELPSVGIGLAVLFVALLPQVRRIHSFTVDEFRRQRDHHRPRTTSAIWPARFRAGRRSGSGTPRTFAFRRRRLSPAGCGPPSFSRSSSSESCGRFAVDAGCCRSRRLARC